MEEEKRVVISCSSTGYAMVGGDGPLSYTNNSSYQRGSIDAAKLLMQEAVMKKLSINNFLDNTFRIADLGCSTGPNTFLAVQNIIEAVKNKYQSQGLDISLPEFQVFFNDHVSNDFNTLFNSLPKNIKYYASGVPGSFHSRLFPRASIHLFHSSFSLHWLSKLPEEILDRNSLAWNKGRIYYAGAREEVIESYYNQFSRDMDCFLNARAEEVVPGGLMAIIIVARPDGVPHSQVQANIVFEMLGSCFVDLVKKGIIDEQEVDSFNLPIYFVSPEEIEAIIDKNGLFTLERTECLPPSRIISESASRVRQSSAHLRASMGPLIIEKFGHSVLNELFDLFEEKLNHNFPLGENLNIFLLLQRKVND